MMDITTSVEHRHIYIYIPEYWSGSSFHPPWDLPNPGIKPSPPALQADSLPAEPPGKPIYM